MMDVELKSNSQVSSRKTILSTMKARFSAGDLGLLPVIIALFVIWFIFQSVNGNFLSGRNISNLILQIITIGMLGLGETFILLLGEIDLSIGAISGVAAAVLV